MANSDNDNVGYKRPPQHTQFKKGQTGNPKGRPKNIRNFKTELREELAEQIVVRENGREQKITKLRAFVKALVAGAIKGDMRAANALVTFSTKTLTDADEKSQDTNAAPDDQDIIDAFVDRELKRRSTTHHSLDRNTKKAK